MITLENLSFEQKAIAEALWQAKSSDVIIALSLVYGRQEVRAIQELMLAVSLDTVENTDQAQQVLNRFKQPYNK